jgi:hypothetical protein
MSVMVLPHFGDGSIGGRVLHGNPVGGNHRTGAIGAALAVHEDFGLRILADQVKVRELHSLRLHTRTMIRDAREAFVGSQSLRALELDQRREVGVVVRDAHVVKALQTTFESDWEGKRSAIRPAEPAELEATEPTQDEKKTAQILLKELRPVALTVKRAVKKVAAQAGDQAIHDEVLSHTVKKIVKKAVKAAVIELDHARSVGS